MSMNHRNLLFALIALAACGVHENHTPPDVEAAKFIKDLGIQVNGKPSCATVDTDNDGYVTCTVAVPNGDKVELMSIQCGAAFGQSMCDGCDCTQAFAEGCKQSPYFKQP